MTKLGTRRRNIIRYGLIVVAAIITLWTLQAVAFWLPFGWAQVFAANATVWPIIQVSALVIIVACAVGLAVLRNYKLAITFTSLAILCAVPTVQMMSSLQRFGDKYGLAISVIEQVNVVRSFPTPDQADVKFGRAGESDLRLSGYLAEGDSIHPAVIYVHGGGWSGGSRDDSAEFFQWLNAQGYHVFSIDYRTARTDYASWKDAPTDVTCALAWLNQNQKTYGVDTKNVTLMGDSAGGQLALRAAYGLANGDMTSSCGGNPVSVKSVVGIVPAIDFREMHEGNALGAGSRSNVEQYLGGSPGEKTAAYDDATIINHVKPGLPRTLIINAARDTLVSANSGEALARKLDETGVEVEQYTLPYAAHSYWINPGGPQNQMAQELIKRFLSVN